MKNLTFLFSTLLCLSVCFSSCGDDDTGGPTPEDLIVTPGQGINDLKIGDLGSKVATELGSGYVPVINVGGSGNAQYNYFNDGAGIDISFGQQSSGDLDIDALAIQSFIISSNFEGETDQGIRIGSTRAEVITAYGEPDQDFSGTSIYDIGMHVNYSSSDIVQSLFIED